MATPRFFISRDQWQLNYEIRFGSVENGIRVKALPVQMYQERTESAAVQERDEPMMTIQGGSFGEETLQSLLDGLWALGFRPADIGTAGHLAATKEHLKDMRALVSKALDVKL